MIDIVQRWDICWILCLKNFQNFSWIDLFETFEKLTKNVFKCYNEDVKQLHRENLKNIHYLFAIYHKRCYNKYDASAFGTLQRTNKGENQIKTFVE